MRDMSPKSNMSMSMSIRCNKRSVQKGTNVQMTEVFVVQRDDRQTQIENVPVVAVCATRRQALRSVVIDVLIELLEFVPIAEDRRYRWIPKYWIRCHPIDRDTEHAGTTVDTMTARSRVWHPRIVVDLDDRLKNVIQTFDTEKKIRNFLSDMLRREGAIDDFVRNLTHDPEDTDERIF